jgi:molybdopterin converting factor small subunit
LIEIRVCLFAGARELVGAGVLAQSLPDGATVQDAVDMLFAAQPDLRALRLRFAVNAAYASPDTMLADGDEMACIPPVGGG